jgi:hypothetical protein
MVTNVTALSDNIGLLLNLSNEEGNRYLGNRTSAITSDLSNLRKMYKEVL